MSVEVFANHCRSHKSNGRSRVFCRDMAVIHKGIEEISSINIYGDAPKKSYGFVSSCLLNS